MLIHSRQILAALPCITNNTTHYALNAVRLSQTGTTTTAEATNGHIDVRITGPSFPWSDGPLKLCPEGANPRTAPACVPADRLATLAKLGKKNKSSIDVLSYVAVTDAGECRATDLAQIATAQAENNASFPDTDKLYARNVPNATRLIVSVKVLTSLLASLKAFHAGTGSSTGGTVTLHLPAPNADGLIDDRVGLSAAHEPFHLTGVFMGCRK